MADVDREGAGTDAAVQAARPPFCQECGALLFLPKTGRDVVCGVCAFKQPCAGTRRPSLLGGRDRCGLR